MAHSPNKRHLAFTESLGNTDQMNKETRTDSLLRSIKNNRWAACTIVASIILLAIVSLVEAISKAGTIFGAHFAAANTQTAYDAATKEAIISVARAADSLLLHVEQRNGMDNLSAKEWDSYLSIWADLRSLLLRSRVRPLNHVATQVTELVIQNWEDVGQLLRMPNPKNAAKTTREILSSNFASMLELEERNRTGK